MQGEDGWCYRLVANEETGNGIGFDSHILLVTLAGGSSNGRTADWMLELTSC